MSVDKVDAALNVFRQTYKKVVGGDVTLGTEDDVMITISTFVIRKHNMDVTEERNLGVTEHRAKKYMPILKAWKEVEKARFEVAKADKERLEADEAEKV